MPTGTRGGHTSTASGAPAACAAIGSGRNNVVCPSVLDALALLREPPEDHRHATPVTEQLDERTSPAAAVRRCVVMDAGQGTKTARPSTFPACRSARTVRSDG